jgi:hypothetical protein
MKEGRNEGRKENMNEWIVVLYVNINRNRTMDGRIFTVKGRDECCLWGRIRLW